MDFVLTEEPAVTGAEEAAAVSGAIAAGAMPEAAVTELPGRSALALLEPALPALRPGVAAFKTLLAVPGQVLMLDWAVARGWRIDCSLLGSRSYFMFEFDNLPMERLVRIPLLLTRVSAWGILGVWRQVPGWRGFPPARAGVDCGYELRCWDGLRLYAVRAGYFQ